jgi:hypothetical protein
MATVRTLFRRASAAPALFWYPGRIFPPNDIRTISLDTCASQLSAGSLSSLIRAAWAALNSALDLLLLLIMLSLLCAHTESFRRGEKGTKAFLVP